MRTFRPKFTTTVHLQGSDFKGLLKDFVQSNIAMLIIATMPLIFGTILVVLHNIWFVDWRLSITLLSWLTILHYQIIPDFYPENDRKII